MLGVMRWGALLVIAGCGRFGFAPEADAALASDAWPDAWPDVPPGCGGPDEDADGWPNACDNCVTEPNPDQRDRGELDAGALADGVGDACDPRPGLAGDYVALAELHDDAMTAYTLFNATSFPGNGALRIGALDGMGSATYAAAAQVTRVDSAYTIVDGSSDQIHWMGVWGEAGTDAVFLEAAYDPAGSLDPVFRIKEQRPNGDRYSPDILHAPRFAAGQRFRVVGDSALATGGAYRLSVTDRILGSTNTTTLALQFPWAAGGYLEANRIVVDFEYLVVYAIR